MLGFRERRRRDRKECRFRPACDRLEGRELAVVYLVTGTAVPQFLQPAKGQTVNVTISGEVANTLKQKPQVSYQVVDEYRIINSTGNVPLTLLVSRPGVHVYSYSIKVPLTAQVSSHDTNGRSYYVLISAGDSQNGQGKYVPVLVPLHPVPVKAHRRTRS
jgi:hypothetical protein